LATKLFDKAKKNKADEFYTQLCDIEEEMRHYRNHFRDKVIFCNCDDPFESNFFKFFAMNFNFLGIKKLIATCYNGSPIAGDQLSLLDVNTLNVIPKNNFQPYKIEINEVIDENGDGAIDLSDVEYLLKNKKNNLSLLEGDGDFRSIECINLLKEADIVVTNPPFSLFREFISLLIEYNKDFIIIGNKNAITYKETFKLIKENKFFVGNRPMAGGMWFFVPDDYDYDKVINGKNFKNVPSCWFTSLKIIKHDEYLHLYKKFTDDEFPTYVNFEAINVDKVSEIPYDYNGFIGVPITFLDKYNPKQFEIIALGIVGSIDFSNNREMEILKNGKPTGKFTINAKGTLYKRYIPLIDKKPPAFRDVENGELYSSIYARIIIKRIGEKNEN
jgi:hypothetical protein